MRTSRSSGTVPSRGSNNKNLKRISTMAGAYDLRKYSIRDLRQLKGKRTLVETLAFTPQEAAAAEAVAISAGCEGDIQFLFGEDIIFVMPLASFPGTPNNTAICMRCVSRCGQCVFLDLRNTSQMFNLELPRVPSA